MTVETNENERAPSGHLPLKHPFNTVHPDSPISSQVDLCLKQSTPNTRKCVHQREKTLSMLPISPYSFHHPPPARTYAIGCMSLKLHNWENAE